MRFPGPDILVAAVVALVILPVEVLAVPLFLTARDIGMTGSPAAVGVGLTVPFVAKAFNIQHFLAWPTELEEAAVLDGASAWQPFWRIALPAMRPALATVVLLDVLVQWSDFLWPLLMTTRESTRTVQIGLANLFTNPPLDWGAILACAVLATLPVLVAFRWFQRFLVVSDARSGLRRIVALDRGVALSPGDGGLHVARGVIDGRRFVLSFRGPGTTTVPRARAHAPESTPGVFALHARATRTPQQILMHYASLAEDPVVYNICPHSAWVWARRTGQITRSPEDARDGYVPLLRSRDVEGRLARRLVARRIRSDQLPPLLRSGRVIASVSKRNIHSAHNSAASPIHAGATLAVRPRRSLRCHCQVDPLSGHARGRLEQLLRQPSAGPVASAAARYRVLEPQPAPAHDCGSLEQTVLQWLVTLGAELAHAVTSFIWSATEGRTEEGSNQASAARACR